MSSAVHSASAKEQIACKVFIQCIKHTETPHFSTVSYNFRHRFTAEIVDQVFAWILEEVAEAGYLSSKAVFIDGTHIKANANTKKRVKAAIPAASKHYAKELMEEVNADREARGKKPFEDDDEPPKPPKNDSDEVLRYIYEYGYTAEQIASAMSTDINLVALKVAHLATLGYNLHALEHKSNFLNNVPSRSLDWLLFLLQIVQAALA